MYIMTEKNVIDQWGGGAATLPLPHVAPPLSNPITPLPWLLIVNSCIEGTGHYAFQLLQTWKDFLLDFWYIIITHFFISNEPNQMWFSPKE